MFSLLIGSGLVCVVYLAHGNGEVDGGCFLDRVGGGVSIFAWVNFLAWLDNLALDKAAGFTTISFPKRLEALGDHRLSYKKFVWRNFKQNMAF